jgi:acetylcholinesterase
LLFGTFQLYGNATPTALEYAISAHWQDLYLAFAKDPVQALPAMGWPAWTPDGGTYMFGANNDTEVSALISVESLVSQC